MTSELKSFSAASRVLGLTPAAVSKSIGELEQTLGIRLFHRNTRNLSLTEDGRKLLLAISPALNTLEQALSQSQSVELKPTGKLKINIPESFGKKFILPLLPEFLRRYSHCFARRPFNCVQYWSCGDVCAKRLGHRQCGKVAGERCPQKRRACATVEKIQACTLASKNLLCQQKPAG